MSASPQGTKKSRVPLIVGIVVVGLAAAFLVPKILARIEAKRKAEAEQAKNAYMQERIALYDIQARYREGEPDGKVPGVVFKVRNNGDRDLDMVQVTILFRNSNAIVIHEENFRPVGDSTQANNKALKAGTGWQLEDGKFYTAKNILGVWVEGSVEAKISDIKFAAAVK